MNRIVGFGQFLAYRIGGAEEATVELLRQRSAKGDAVTVVSYEQLTNYKVVPQRMKFPNTWHVQLVTRKYAFTFFQFVEYCLNRKALQHYFESVEGDELLAFSIYSPAAIRGFQGKRKVFYVQSDVVLGVPQNHFKGWRYWAKAVYLLLEAPFRRSYIRDVRAILKDCEVHCNSEFMAQLLEKHFGVTDAKIVYPSNNIEEVRARYAAVCEEIEEKGVVFVGDTAHKGLHTAQAIAELLPEQQFYFFSKKEAEARTVGNVTYMPWQRHAADVYKYANLVIMPSVWQETFGRVGREAYSLGIPTLVSNVGGLPEAVYQDQACLVDDFTEAAVWAKRIAALKLGESKG